jgi:hypothetical protein
MTGKPLLDTGFRHIIQADISHSQQVGTSMRYIHHLRRYQPPQQAQPQRGHHLPHEADMRYATATTHPKATPNSTTSVRDSSSRRNDPMAQPYSLFIPDWPVITIHLDDDELHCAEFGRIYNHDTEEQDAHQPGKQQRTLVCSPAHPYATHPTVRARLATPNQIGSQKLSV